MKFLIFLSVLILSGIVLADTPFNIDKFHASQEAGEKILLHFHADWCPTCKAQKKVLAQFESSGNLNKIKVSLS